jgi:ankyrin repeat protein
MGVSQGDVAAVLTEAAPETLSHEDNRGQTAFHRLSVSEHNLDGLKELCRHVQSVDYQSVLNDSDVDGDTALHVAMTYANLAAVKLLLESGAEVLGSGHQGYTALMKPSQTWAWSATVNKEVMISGRRLMNRRGCV